MTALPLVSVCFICYRQAAFVGEALRSAVEQTYPNLEVVVADDGSDDGTWEIVQNLAKAYPERVRLLEKGENQGLPGIVRNYNRALTACRGEFVAFLEGDDVWLPGKIEAQVAWFGADETNILCGHDVEAFEDETGRVLYQWSERFGLSAGLGPCRIIERGVPFSTVSVMVRRIAFPSGGFDDRLRAVLDWKMWIDCLSRGGRFGHVALALARYRRHAANITRHFTDVRRNDLFVTLALVESEHPEFFRSVRRGRAHVARAIGVEELAQGHLGPAHDYLRMALTGGGCNNMARAAGWFVAAHLPEPALWRYLAWRGVSGGA